MDSYRTAIITGSGRGIGAATAKLLAAAGYRVCINYVSDEDSAQALVSELRAGGTEAIAVAADVGSEADIVRLFDTVDTQLGRVSALVNNAGILFPQARLDAMSAERIRRVLSVNVAGAIICCREAIRRMSTRHGGQGGAIVNVSSVASRLGAPGEYVDYAASKGALDSLTVGLSREVAAEGIRVNCVRPGYIHTGIHAQGGEPGRVDRLAKALPMGRGGTPDEVGRAIAWLLSDEASYVTGSFVDAAGGR